MIKYNKNIYQYVLQSDGGTRFACEATVLKFFLTSLLIFNSGSQHIFDIISRYVSDTNFSDTNLPDISLPDNTFPHSTLPENRFPNTDTSLPDTSLPDTSYPKPVTLT